jgi:hypothetical protein
MRRCCWGRPARPGRAPHQHTPGPHAVGGIQTDVVGPQAALLVVGPQAALLVAGPQAALLTVGPQAALLGGVVVGGVGDTRWMVAPVWDMVCSLDMGVVVERESRGAPGRAQCPVG